MENCVHFTLHNIWKGDPDPGYRTQQPVSLLCSMYIVHYDKFQHSN